MRLVCSQPAPIRSGSGPSDAALVVAIRDGEEWAAEALFRRHAAKMNGLAYRLLGRDADVDDLVQDTFVDAFSGLSRLREPDAFGAWLRSILVYRATKLIRRRRLLARLGLAHGGSEIDLDALIAPVAPADAVAELRRIYTAIEHMPAELRVPLLLRRVEGLSLAEVAEATGVSLATVKRRLKQAERGLDRLATSSEGAA